MQNCKQEEEEKKKKKKLELMMMMFHALFIIYMRIFCAPSQAFLPSFILTRIPSASNFEHNAHPQSSPLLFMKDVSALLCRYLVTPHSKNTKDLCYYVHNIITPVVHQLLPAQIDCSVFFSSRQNCGNHIHICHQQENSIHM